jgi:hypothetical protein
MTEEQKKMQQEIKKQKELKEQKQKETDCDLENYFGLLELFALVIKEVKETNVPFPKQLILDTNSYKRWLYNYEKKVSRNIKSLINHDCKEIIFATLVDLAEIFLDFKKDDAYINMQASVLSAKHNPISTLKGTNPIFDDNILLLEKYAKLRLGIITEEELLSSYNYKGWIKRIENKNENITYTTVKHDKVEILDKILKIYKEIFIDKKEIIRSGEVK